MVSYQNQEAPPAVADDRTVRRYRTANAGLRGVVGLVALYGLAMVFAGRTFAVPLFDVLGFGPNAFLSARGEGNAAAVDGTCAVQGRDALLDYCVFMFGVLGAVIVGWMASLWYLVHDGCMLPQPSPPPPGASSPLLLPQPAPRRRSRAASRGAVAASAAIWFVVDTGFSLAVGEWRHAAFNVPFAMLLAVPLVVMGRADHDGGDGDGDGDGTVRGPTSKEHATMGTIN
jgi:hypothetical protein